MCPQKDLMKFSPGSFMFLCIEMCLCEVDCGNASQRHNACWEWRPLSHTNRHRFFNFILSQFQPPISPRAPSVTQMFTHINTQTHATSKLHSILTSSDTRRREGQLILRLTGLLLNNCETIPGQENVYWRNKTDNKCRRIQSLRKWSERKRR